MVYSDCKIGGANVDRQASTVSNNIDHSKAFMIGVNILDKWQCNSAQKQAILSVPKSTYHRYLKEPKSVFLNSDQLERPSYIANIHHALRIVFSNPFPPITLFDDVIDAEGFETAYALQALTDPRIQQELGNLALLKTEEIPFGIKGVNYVTAQFTDVNPNGSRFSNSEYGVLYLADSVETAIAETRYHQQIYFQNIQALHFDSIDMRCLKLCFSASLVDVRQKEELHLKDDYSAAQTFGAKTRKENKAGLQYNSVRRENSLCWALMSPKFVHSAIQTSHFVFTYEGKRISKVSELSNSSLV